MTTLAPEADPAAVNVQIDGSIIIVYLAAEDAIQPHHLAEALQYRPRNTM